MRVLTVFSLPLLLCLPQAATHAQTGAGDVLIGRVTDVTGQPIPEAQVGATSLTSGLRRLITTDAEGHYRIFFPETSRQYTVMVKRMGFVPVQRTITRRTSGPEQMTIDMQLGGMPLALSMVEISGSAGGSIESLPPERKAVSADAIMPNPVAEILALKDTLHLSAVQIVALTDVADTLRVKNVRIYKDIRTLLAKAQESGDGTQMAGSVAMMLEQAASNTTKAVTAAEKLLRPEQWQVVPLVIRDQSQNGSQSPSQQ